MLVLLALLALLAAVCGAAAAVFARQAAQAVLRPAGPTPIDPELFHRLALLERQVDALPRSFREDFGGFRQELKQELLGLYTNVETRIGRSEQGQTEHLRAMREEQAQGRQHAGEAMDRHVTGLADTHARRSGETTLAMKELRERTEAVIAAMSLRLEALTKDSGDKHEALREQVRGQMDALRQGNEAKLDEMRGVVDEKLSATLETRLGEKFKTVSDHLEAVHKGLGEMQSLATGVGDLKRVLTNVKTRGTWGELRLGQLLEDMLPGQFEAQVAVRAGAGERVDYAIRLPGKAEGEPLWLPIDCKFPQEDFDRLQHAQDRGDPAEVEGCAAALERAVRLQAKSIAAKYVHPPQTTPFAFLYLPTEGLYAEVIRRPGLVSDLQTGLGIMVAGPSTLAANLMSLQMGFHSLRVEKRAAEVWTVLGEAKSEFAKYGVVWDKLGKKLDDAKGLHEEVAKRSRAVDRKLRGVEALEPAEPLADAAPRLALGHAAEPDDEAEAA